MNLEFDPTADTAKQNYESCKANLKMFQHNKITNHQAIGNQQKQSTTSTFIASLDNNEEFDQEQVKAIKTFLSDISTRGGKGGGQRGRVRGGQAGGGLGQSKRLWKCDFCICSHPKWKDCGCECVNHRKEKCPNPDLIKVKAHKRRKAEQDQNRHTKHRKNSPKQGFLTYTQGSTNQIVQEESEYEILTLATKVREVEAEFQPLHKLHQALKINTGLSTSATNEMIDLEDNITRQKWKIKETSKHDLELTMLVDCGSPSTSWCRKL